MLLIVAIVALAGLTAFNYAQTKSYVAPSTVYAAVWTLALLGILASGDSFFPISAMTLLIYVVGAIAFTAGSLPALSFVENPAPAVSGMEVRRTRLILDVLLVLCVLGIPAYWELASRLTWGIPSLQYFLSYARNRSLHEMTSQPLDPIANLPVLAVLVAFGMFLETDGTMGRRIRAVLAILLAVLYGSALGSKSGAVTTLLSITFLHGIRQKEVKIKALLPGVAAAAGVFSAGVLAINYAFFHFRSVSEALSAVGKTFQLYWLGGIVAFDRIVQFPNSIEATQGISRVFLLTANSLGADFYVPNLHAGYVAISPNGLSTNVYTAYFSYYPTFGFLGVLLFPALLGAIATWVYSRARSGSRSALLMYGILTAGLVIASSTEQFFMALNYIGKSLVFCWLIYMLPAMGQKAAALRREAAAAANLRPARLHHSAR